MLPHHPREDNLYLLAGRGEGRPLHEQKEAADRRNMHATRCMEFRPLPTASPNNSDPFVDTLSVLFVAFVPYDLYVPDPFVASLYLSVKYPFEL